MNVSAMSPTRLLGNISGLLQVGSLLGLLLLLFKVSQHHLRRQCVYSKLSGSFHPHPIDSLGITARGWEEKEWELKCEASGSSALGGL
jgi:hypothetical protein